MHSSFLLPPLPPLHRPSSQANTLVPTFISARTPNVHSSHIRNRKITSHGHVSKRAVIIVSATTSPTFRTHVSVDVDFSLPGSLEASTDGGDLGPKHRYQQLKSRLYLSGRIWIFREPVLTRSSALIWPRPPHGHRKACFCVEMLIAVKAAKLERFIKW